MRLIYVDESGNTGKNTNTPDQPLLVLTALVIEPQYVRVIEQAVQQIGEKYFGPVARNTDFEFHGAEIYQRKGRYFKGIDQAKSFDILDELINVATKNSFISIGYVTIEKSKYYARQHIQQSAFSLLIERIEKTLSDLDSFGLMICDENQELEQLLIDDLDRYKKIGTDFGYKNTSIEKLVDSVHFVKSNNNNLMQLCDVICYVIFRGKQSKAHLLEEYNLSGSKADFHQWVINESPHKGRKYFYRLYSNIKFVFCKNFP